MKNLSNTEVAFLRLLQEKYNFEFLSHTHSICMDDNTIIPTEKEIGKIDQEGNVFRDMER